jgi:phospholipid/cholesterol/gamma-HCH transport system substrate-binding protein
MPPKTRAGWPAVLPGLAILAGLLGIAAAIVVFAHPGALHGDTFRLYVTTDDATGVMKGTEVWLAGQKVGRVLSIGYQPATTSAEERVLVETEVLERHHAAIRRDSRVHVAAGGSFLGAPVVQISAGTPRASAVTDGDTVHAEVRGDLEALASRAAIGGRELPRVMENVKLLREAVRATNGTIGSMRAGSGLPGLDEARGRTGTLMGRVRGGRGTIGLALDGRGALMGRAKAAMARADSIMALLDAPGGNVGRFRRDSTLLREVAAVRDELSIVGHLLQSPDGTMGRMRQDRAIQEGLAGAQREMTALFADLKAHPFRYISF